MSFQIEKAVQTSANFVNGRPKILLGASNTASEMDVFAASRSEMKIKYWARDNSVEAWLIIILREHQEQRLVNSLESYEPNLLTASMLFEQLLISVNDCALSSKAILP
jgi:hypothetical protein